MDLSLSFGINDVNFMGYATRCPINCMATKAWATNLARILKTGIDKSEAIV